MKTITDAVNKVKGELRWDASHVISNSVGTIASWHDDAPITLLGRCWRIVCTNAEFNAHVKQLTGCPVKLKQWQDSKMNKLVYTKTMQDAGELPSVGMECNFVTSFFTLRKSNSETCKIIAYHGEKVWLDFGKSESVINLSVIEFSPIDTRTDKEKAIDAELVSCTGYTDDIRNALSNAYDKWVK